MGSQHLLLTGKDLDALIQTLRQARTVIGPTVADGVIAHKEIYGLDDLPKGWTERQDGGSYRLEPTGTDERFAFSTPSSSWKRFVYPERSLVISARREGQKVTVHGPSIDPPAMAFFGIRSCDLAALGILDRVFADPAATDPGYRAVRDDVFIVAVGCNRPGGTCFCVSMDTGPSPKSGFDLSISELVDPGDETAPIEYLIEVGSDRGAAVLADLPTREPDDRHHQMATSALDRARVAMGRTLDPADPPLAAGALTADRWEDVAERCLSCGNCTMVCPTCFCGKTEDLNDLSGDLSERFRVWDSCFSMDFTHLHDGPTRVSVASRYRHWLLHKLVTWHDQFGTSGCVGCGRCVTWCPVGIDLTEEVAATADQARQTNTTVGGDWA